MNDKTNAVTSTQVPARRQVVTGMVMALGGLAVGAKAWGQLPGAQAAENNLCSASHARSELHYKVEYKASPQRIYEALLDSKQFAAFTGLPAEIDAKVGGAASMFGGMIVARNIELVPNQRIVQAWRPAHWEAGLYSIVRFEMTPHGAGSFLILDHTGFPEANADSLDQGWHAHYIDGLRKYFS